ncbi:MAG: type II toxin-antitoxin system HipA family toxin [Myxococcaceae bacterium]
MGRRSKVRALDVWMNGEHVGRWTVNRGEHSFAYEESWLASAHRRPLSLSLPLRPPAEPYRTAVVEPYFDNLLPDSNDIRRRMMGRFGTESTSAFDLLEQAGRDCVGAVQLLPADAIPADVRRIRGRPVKDAEIASILARVRSPMMGMNDEDDFRISLAGAQEKTAFLWNKDGWWVPEGTTPTTHLFKLPILSADASAVDVSASLENEWLCSQLLPLCGIACAKSELQTFKGQSVLVVERFDRQRASETWILRRPQEDFCQATGTFSGRKYESQGGPGLREIMQLLHGSTQALKDREDFFRTHFLFWLLCAIDGHAKNFSVFIEREGRFALTPRYDVLSAYPYLGRKQNQLSPHKVKMAMAVLGKTRHYRWKEIRVDHWLETGRQCGLPQSGRQLMEEVAHQAEAAARDLSSRLPRGFPVAVSEPILHGLESAARRAQEALASA